jgi:glycosyltransferase involved in cell wall biosynthesis
MSLQLAVVVPAYNEEACIKQVITAWQEGIAQLIPSEEFVIMVVNDGSKDRTGELLDELSKELPNLTVIHQANGGHGMAVVNGYKNALRVNPEYIFQTDSDDQFLVTDFEKLWSKRKESKFILGFRRVRHDAPFRLFITQILKYSLLFIYGTNIADANIPYRLIEKNFLQKLIDSLPKQTPFAPNIFLSVMAKKAGQDVMNIPIKHVERQTGEVSIRHFKLLKVCWQSFKELLQFRFNLGSIVKYLK